MNDHSGLDIPQPTARSRLPRFETRATSYEEGCEPSPAKLLELWQGRWEIENRLFRVRDVVFREDHSRIRTGTAALATSHVRNAAINYLRTRKVDNNAAALLNFLRDGRMLDTLARLASRAEVPHPERGRGIDDRFGDERAKLRRTNPLTTE